MISDIEHILKRDGQRIGACKVHWQHPKQEKHNVEHGAGIIKPPKKSTSRNPYDTHRMVLFLGW